MSELGEMFAEMKARRKARNLARKSESTALLLSSGIKFESKNYGEQLIIMTAKGVIDFYPSTGQYIKRASKKRQNGVNKLIKQIGVQL